MKIIAVKTTLGEELIAKIKKDEEDYFILEDARALMLQQDSSGAVRMAMVPFLVSASDPTNKVESDVKLYKREIMAEVIKIASSLEKEYRQSVTNIALVN